MEPFTKTTGVVVPMDRVNVDTDQIIPKQFLKRIERTGFGQFLFNDLRYLEDGSPNPEFVLNRPGYEGAAILVAGRNFGSGSSREHAAWALLDYGFRCIIAPSFADIFQKNCFDNGIVPVHLPEPKVKEIIAHAQTHPGYQVTVDLEAFKVWYGEGFQADFWVHGDPDINEFRRHCLRNGLDDIALTLQHEDEITAFEERRGRWGGVLGRVLGAGG